MKVITEAQAQRILDPHMDRLSATFESAQESWRRFVGALPDVARDVRSRGQSNLLYDFIAGEAERQFTGVPGVRVTRERGFLTLIFADQLVLRFKKFRENRMYSVYGIPTLQKALWDGQHPLPGMPLEATKAVAGYLLDELRQRFTGTYVSCRAGHFLEWVIEIPQSPASATGPSPLPAPTGPESPPPVVRVAKPASGEVRNDPA